MEEKDKIISILDANDIKDFEVYTERKNSLEELKLILNNNSRKDLLDKVEEDIKVIDKEISQWWNEIERRYELVIKNSEDIYVDVYTGEIILKYI
ncbi:MULTISPECIES: hypothetical protein [unclassified Clostridium]|jgi:CXXX repeat modification system protein|uniref:hypothetical protein n=1 Tax=unclassified Clostridium TaxID=2614128 RepID=UPI003218008E